MSRKRWLDLLLTGRSFGLFDSPAEVGERILVREAGRDGASAVVTVIGVEDWGAEVVDPADRYAVDYRLGELS